jgi:hypothetical protein
MYSLYTLPYTLILLQNTYSSYGTDKEIFSVPVPVLNKEYQSNAQLFKLAVYLSSILYSLSLFCVDQWKEEKYFILLRYWLISKGTLPMSL